MIVSTLKSVLSADKAENDIEDFQPVTARDLRRFGNLIAASVAIHVATATGSWEIPPWGLILGVVVYLFLRPKVEAQRRDRKGASDEQRDTPSSKASDPPLIVRPVPAMSPKHRGKPTLDGLRLTVPGPYEKVDWKAEEI